MGRPRRGIGAELLAVTLIGGCLAGTLVVVVSIHRRQPVRRPTAPSVVLLTPAPKVALTPAPEPPPLPPPAPPPVDPTKKIVAELASAEAEQRAEAEKAAQRIAALETATRAALAESDRAKRTLSLTRAQLDAREADANRREGEAQMAAFERDALAKRRDVIQKSLEQDRERPSYAVLPHRGPHGTWQRPIVIECKGDGVTLRPVGKSFALMEIISPFGLGGNSFLGAVAREAIRVQRQTAPDGVEIVPYIFFIIRPDGVRSYYEARTKLERIGIAFGYELADAEWAIDVPDLDNPATWDGSPPPLNLGTTVSSAPSGLRGGASGPSGRGGDIDNAFIWPKAPPGTGDDGGRRGIVGLATPGTGDQPSPRTPGRPRDEGRGGSGADFVSDLEDSGLAGGRGPSRDGAGDGSPHFGGQPSGTGRGGDGGDAWGRLHERYDPSRPAGLASLARGGGGSGHGADAAPEGIPGVSRRDEILGASGDRTDGDGGGGGAPGSGNNLGGRGDSDERGSGLRGRGGAGGGGGQSEGNLALPGSGLPEGGRGGSGSQGTAGEGGGRPGSTGSQGTAGEGQAGSPRGGEFGQAGGGEGIKSPLGGLGMTSRPIEMVLACGPKGVAVYPGDYRVTKATLKEKDELLVAQLRAIVRRREEAQPDRPLHPKIRYVVEPGGRETYAMARGQLALSGLGWSTSTQVSGGDVFRLFSTDDW